MAVPSVADLPVLTPKNYRWKPVGADERYIQRRCIGAEAIVGLEEKNRRGQYDLYMIISLKTVVSATSETVLTLSYLKEKFELALLVARFQHPECAATVSWDEQVAAMISYQPPENDEAALAWARDCVHVLPTSKSAYDVWGALEEKRGAENDMTPSKPFEAFLITNVAHPDAAIPSGAAIDVLVHSNHLFWDGTSCRLFAGDVLRNLNGLIGLPAGQEAPKQPWGGEVDNLSPPILDSLCLNVDTLGVEFDDKCKEYISALVGNYVPSVSILPHNLVLTIPLQSSRGLPFTPGLGLPRCELQTLSAENSKAIVMAVKTRLGPAFTITHLTQAAILLALLDTIRPTDLIDDEVYVTPTSVDGRRWMRPPVASQFYAMCQTAAVVRVGNLKAIHVRHQDDREVQVQALEHACRDVKASYDQWLKNPYQEALGLRVHNFEANYLNASPVPFQKDEANPLFISDGINERFFPRDITSTATAETFFTVERLSFLVNQMLPYLAIRLDSWRDASTVSIIYNEANYTKAEVQAFLKSVIDFMLAFVLQGA